MTDQPAQATMPDERWVDVGALDEVPRAGARRVKRVGKPHPVAVFRTKDDRVFGLINRCPHRGAPLSEGIIRGCIVACPLHGWVIDLDSGKAQPPDEGTAGSIATQVVDGRIYVASWAVSSPGGWE